MSNPKLSSLMAEAMNAPLGSSKREKVSSMLRSLAIDKRMNGQGGMADPAALGVSNPYLNKPVTKPVQTPVNNGVSNPYTAGPLTQPATNEVQFGTTPQIYHKPVSTDVKEKLLSAGTFTANNPPFIGPETNPIREGDTRINPDTGKSEVYSVLGEWVESNNAATMPPDVATNPNGVDEWYYTLTKDEQDRFSPLYEAYKGQVGPKTTAINIMSDKEKMKKMFPNIPEDQLPIGASLAGQLNDLEVNLKKETKLNDYKANLENLRDQGVTIDEDIQTYINERDSYGKSLDRMINNFQEKTIKMDMSNPYNAKIADNYMGYLTVLKGREQKGYADYLKRGVQYYNDTFKMAENNYNRLKSQFDEELSSAKDFTKEKFNYFSTMIEEMATSLKSKEESQLKKLKYTNDVIEENKKIVNNSLGIDDKFDSYTNGIKGELQQGQSQWREAWNNVKTKYPNASNATIDNALGGGIASTQAEADKHGVSVGEPWGWARPGAYQQMIKDKKVSTPGSNIFNSLPTPETTK